MGIVLRLTIERTEALYRGQDHFWRVILTLGADGRTFSAGDVGAVSQEPHIATITSYLRRLALAGLIKRDGTALRASSGRREHLYRLLRAPAEAPRVHKTGAQRLGRTAQQQMWNVMRGPGGRDGFTFHDLVAFGSTDDLHINQETAKRYVRALRRAGYLLPVAPGGPGVAAAWRLKPSMNTGPKPPMILRARLVYDQNRQLLQGEAIAEEEAR